MGFPARLWITENGKKYLSDAQLGKELRFTKMVMGDGDISGREPSVITDMISPRLDVGIIEARRMNTQTLYIRGDYTSAEILQGFYFREFGLYADQGDGTTEVLYCYGNSGELAEYIDAQSGSSTVEKMIALEIAVNNAENVTVEFSGSALYALKSELDDIYDGTTPVGKAQLADKLATPRTIAISGGATGTATTFDGSGNITIPITGLDMGKANAGTLPVVRGGTGLTAAPSMLIDLSSATAVNPLSPSPRPGATGILPIGKGGTGATSVPNTLRNYFPTGVAPGSIPILGNNWENNGYCTPQALRSAMGLGNTLGAVPVANGGTGAASPAAARENLGITMASGTMTISLGNTFGFTTGTFYWTRYGNNVNWTFYFNWASRQTGYGITGKATAGTLPPSPVFLGSPGGPIKNNLYSVPDRSFLSTPSNGAYCYFEAINGSSVSAWTALSHFYMNFRLESNGARLEGSNISTSGSINVSGGYICQ